MSAYISKLGEHTRERIDHKRAGFRLWQQDKNVLEYHQRRTEFFEKVFLHRDMSSMNAFSDFLDREDIMEINEDLRNLSQTLGKEINKSSELFKNFYAKPYQQHYQDIMEQIQEFAAYDTPIEKFPTYENIDTVFYIDTGAGTQGEF